MSAIFKSCLEMLKQPPQEYLILKPRLRICLDFAVL